MMRQGSRLWRGYCTTPVGETAITFSDGKCMRLSTGKYAKMCDGSVLGTMGETVVMSTVVNKPLKTIGSFLPLTVDYREKYSAYGRIPKNYLKREMGLNEREIITSRIIDRSVRPMVCSKSVETNIVCNLLAVDGVFTPDIIAINAASASLTISSVPFNTIGAVRVACIDKAYVINPNADEIKHSDLNVVIVGGEHSSVVMIDAEANNVLLPDFLHAIKIGVKETQILVNGIKAFGAKHGKPKADNPVEFDNDVFESVKSLTVYKLTDVFTDSTVDKLTRDKRISEIRESLKDKFEIPVTVYFDRVVKETFRQVVFDTSRRCDGRGPLDLRPIHIDVDLFKPVHGSCVYTRGQTQVLCTVSFDSIYSSSITNDITREVKNFFLHYEFPGFATNEIGKSGVGRRELGHGALAEKAIKAVIPKDFPYAVRLTSQVLESNGSSSMATVCGGSLALMDAGVPVTSHVAGIALGVFVNGDKYVIMNDILGIEDYFGDMDFKLAGTKKGVTALQVDVKVPGLSSKIIMEACIQGFEGKNKVIEIMRQSLQSHRTVKKANWPVNELMHVPVHKTSKFIGVGGRNIKFLEKQVGVTVTQVDMDHWDVFAPSSVVMDNALAHIAKFMEDKRMPELIFGAIYKCKIVEVKDIGVMVQVHQDCVALLHNSQIDSRKIHHPSALGLEVGQELLVKYFGRDPVSGSIRLSRKILLSNSPNNVLDLNSS